MPIFVDLAGNLPRCKLFNPPREPSRIEQLLRRLDEINSELLSRDCTDADALAEQRRDVLDQLASIGYRP